MIKDKDVNYKKILDTIFKIVLIIIIIILLIHNCVLIKLNDNYKNKPASSGNIDIIEITCSNNQCKPVNPANDGGNNKPSGTVGINSISFSQNKASVKVGEKLTLMVIIKPSSLASSKLTWKSSDSSIATVDSNGIVKGLKKGTVTITVTTANGKSAICVLNVTGENVNVEEIKLNTNKSEIKVGNSEQIIATVSPSNATNRNLTWTSSDPSVAKVDSNGVVTGLKEGTVTITVTSADGKTSSCTVNVIPNVVSVNEVVLSPSNLSINVGSTGKINANILPEDATDKTLTWTSSDPSVATVDSNGVVKGISKGTVTITVTSSNGKKTTCTVTVSSNIVEVKEIKVDPTNTCIEVGSTGKINVSVLPEDATDKKITWVSSNPDVATVDSNGVIKGVSEGTVTITAVSSNGKVATTTVTVNPKKVAVSEVKVNPTTITLNVDSTAQIKATVLPEDATDKTITWVSSDPSVAKVDSNGVVTGLKEGTATITITSSNGKKTTATVTVTSKNIEVTEVKANPTSATVKIGSTAQITASVLPDNATDKSVTWTSSDPSVATVDSNGVITGLKEGTTTITITSSNGKKATCVVTVSPNVIPVDSITLDHSSTTIKVDETLSINATVLPEDATDKNIIWTSSDPSVATVDSSGVVKGLKEGTVTITAKTIDGTKEATCTVKVEYNDGLNVYDDDKNPVVWNGSTELNIFNRSQNSPANVIAPLSSDVYQFVVQNNTAYKLKYQVKFLEDNPYYINMKYRLKKNDSYIIDSYVSAGELNISDMILNISENDTFYLEWKWFSSDNDTEIGANPNSYYGLKIEIKAESIDG